MVLAALAGWTVLVWIFWRGRFVDRFLGIAPPRCPACQGTCQGTCQATRPPTTRPPTREPARRRLRHGAATGSRAPAHRSCHTTTHEEIDRDDQDPDPARLAGCGRAAGLDGHDHAGRWRRDRGRAHRRGRRHRLAARRAVRRWHHVGRAGRCRRDAPARGWPGRRQRWLQQLLRRVHAGYHEPRLRAHRLHHDDVRRSRQRGRGCLLRQPGRRRDVGQHRRIAGAGRRGRPAHPQPTCRRQRRPR